MNNKRTDRNYDVEYWLALSEKYFDALTTIEEEKTLAQFLASDAANHPAFNEIKAVMGYLSTGKSIAQKAKKKRTIGKVTQWASIAACAAAIAYIGTQMGQDRTLAEPESKEIYYAYIDGKEYTDEEFVMQHMLATMSRMSSSGDNVIEQQMGAMFRINN